MARLRSVGLGGGGAMYHPRISPWPPTAARPELMFVACDMDGLYRSADQGQSWTLVDDRTAQGTTRFSVAFDPATPGRVVGFHKTFGLRLSTDYGLTFGAHPVPLPASAAQVTAAGFNGNGTLVVGSRAGLYRLAGGSWTHVTAASGGVSIGDVQALAFSTAQPAWCFALTLDEVFWSSDDGFGWWRCSAALPARSAADPLRDLAAADAAGQLVLYATMASSVHRLALAVTDQPASPPNWAAVTGTLAAQGLGFRDVAVSAADANTVYVSAENPVAVTSQPYATVFKGAYASNVVTWTWAYDGFELHPTTRNLEPGWADLDGPRGRGWGFGGTPLGLVASPRDANVVALTNLAVVHRTDNGAQQSANAWRQRYARSHAPGTLDRWSTTGLDVTTVWHYYRHSDSVRFIASTDIGLARSGDGGDTWSWVGVSDVVPHPINPGQYLYRGTQRTNCYELVQVGSTLFAAVSEEHDIPHDSQLDLGPAGADIGHGAILSSPDGLAWTTVAGATMTAGSSAWTLDTTSDLPDGPVTGLIADAQGVLYASVWGRGVVWSANQGQTWHQLGAFLDAGRQPITNPLCHRLALDSAGNLFCATAAERLPAQVQGALWQLPAAQMAPGAGQARGDFPVGAAWDNKTASLGSVSMADFAFDPANHQRVFACSESVPPGGQGGVFYSRDGGVTWSANLMPYTDPRIATYHPDSLQAFSPAIINDRLFVTTLYNGIWSSAYDGTNAAWTPQWEEFKALPFAGAQRIASRISAGGSRSELYFGTYGAGAWELQRECLFVKDHSSVSRYEVEAQLAAGQATAEVTQVALLVLDGFAGAEVGVSAFALPTLTVAGANAAGVTARLTQLQQSDLDLERPQRLTMRCDLLFTDVLAFPGAAGQSSTLTLTFARGQYQCSTQIELVYPDHPYILDGAAYWLSEGVRVFRATEGLPRFGATLQASTVPGDIPTNAHDYLTKVLAGLNGLGGAATWAQMPADQLASALQIWPTDDQGRNVLNFALAKLTYRGALDATAVRVFFRLSAVIATGLDYDPNGAYRSFDPGAGDPIVPRLGLTTNSGTGLREITTIPCFAQPRANTDGSTPNAQSMDAQADAAFSITAPGAASVDVYVGAWLDINQPSDRRFPLNPPAASGEGPWNPALLSVEELVLGRHQCLVVELHHRFQGGADTLSPGDGPNTTQYLSQRNLAILGSDNPGGPDSHTVVHPFDLRGRAGRPLGAASDGSADDLDDRRRERERPDEVLVWWDDVPEETDATLAFSGITADEVLELNAGRPAPTRLERVDATTVRCPVGGLSSVPLPYREENIAALLTLVLPPGVRAGQRLGCRLQQLGAPEQAIIGAFSVAIPVEKAAQLLPDARDTLAVMRHIAGLRPAADRWTPLLQRYVGLLAAKVDGLGGRAAEVKPSPSGAGSRPDGGGTRPGGCAVLAWKVVRWIARLVRTLIRALRR